MDVSRLLDGKNGHHFWPVGNAIFKSCIDQEGGVGLMHTIVDHGVDPAAVVKWARCLAHVHTVKRELTETNEKEDLQIVIEKISKCNPDYSLLVVNQVPLAG